MSLGSDEKKHILHRCLKQLFLRKQKYTCGKIETSPLHHNDTKKPKLFFETIDCGSNAKKIKYNICDPQTFCNDEMNIPLQ